jgi:hypothetical protein
VARQATAPSRSSRRREATAPLAAIVQATKQCDFGCVFCSETLMMPDPTLDPLDVI